MNRITQFSMKKNVSALFIIMLLLFGSGIYASGELKKENMPDISFPVVVVTTQYAGAPKDVMDEITDPIEEKLAGVEDIDSMSSTSSDNNSMIIIMFKQDSISTRRSRTSKAYLRKCGCRLRRARPRLPPLEPLPWHPIT